MLQGLYKNCFSVSLYMLESICVVSADTSKLGKEVLTDILTVPINT